MAIPSKHISWDDGMMCAPSITQQNSLSSHTTIDLKIFIVLQ